MSVPVPAQLELLKPRGHGGRRKGAGRPRTKERAGVPHRARLKHRKDHPVHITMRARAGLPSFRSDKLLRNAVRGALAECQKSEFRLVHFSVQSNHLHLIVEAQDEVALSRGMQGLTIRMARAVNRTLGVSGTVFDDRYHAHALKTPRETRNVLLYVLQNWAKHGPGGGYDPHSSAVWFDGWSVPPPGGPLPLESIVAKGRTWLVTVGWRRHGLLRPAERPGRLAATAAA